MTIRDLIEQGAGLDDEIDIKVKVYDDIGCSCGVFLNYNEIPFDSFDIVPGRIILKTDVEPICEEGF